MSFTLLNHLPTEVLARITYFLELNPHFALFGTGDALLITKLLRGGVEDVFCVGEETLKLLHRARGLKRLKLDCGQGESRFINFWFALPLSLEYLDVRYYSLNTLPYIDASTPSYPSMRSLTVMNCVAVPPLTRLFPNLQSFTNLQSYNCEPPLSQNSLQEIFEKGAPCSLQSVKIDYIITSSLLSLMPRTLTSLICELEFLDSDAISRLPPSLTHFDVRVSKRLMGNDALLLSLPYTLQTLLLRCAKASRYSSFGFLPSQLVTASFKLEGVVTSTNLPPNLTDLNVLQFDWFDHDLANLPRSLTFLSIVSTHITDQGVKHLPSTLRKLQITNDTKLTDAAFQYLPPGLTFLKLSGKHFTDASIPLLPPSITELCLNSASLLTDAAIPLLPPKLDTLQLNSSTLLTEACLPNFPRSITVLYLYGNVQIKWPSLSLLPIPYICIVFLNASKFKVSKYANEMEVRSF